MRTVSMSKIPIFKSQRYQFHFKKLILLKLKFGVFNIEQTLISRKH